MRQGIHAEWWLLLPIVGPLKPYEPQYRVREHCVVIPIVQYYRLAIVQITRVLSTRVVRFVVVRCQLGRPRAKNVTLQSAMDNISTRLDGTIDSVLNLLEE